MPRCTPPASRHRWSLVIAAPYVGLLGLVPIAIGVSKAFELRNGDGADDDGPHPDGATRYGNAVTVAAVTIANGADNISVYTPLFAMRSGADVAVLGIVFALMTIGWIAAAHWLILYEAGTVALLA